MSTPCALHLPDLCGARTALSQPHVARCLQPRRRSTRFGKRSQTYHAKNLTFFAGAHQDEVSWLEGTGPEVALALRSGGESLATLALEMQRRVDGGKVVPADALRDVLAADPDAIWALAITHRRLYPDLLAQGRFEDAIQLRYAPDRCLAYLELAKSAEGEQRRSYLLSALRENTLLGANPMTSPPEFVQQSVDLLNELARDLEGAEKRFCVNRVRILAGVEPEEGDESLPRVKLADLVEALNQGDFVTARERLQAGRAAGRGREMDRQAWEWWQSAEDPREAFRGLFEIGADSVVRAARKLYGKGRTEDLVAVASYFCSLYPDTRSQWPLLCQHQVTEVREAAADAAKEHGSRAHAPLLARMCADPAQQVRLSAWLALRDLMPEVEASGYDFKSPTPESLAALQRMVD